MGDRFDAVRRARTGMFCALVLALVVPLVPSGAVTPGDQGVSTEAPALHKSHRVQIGAYRSLPVAVSDWRRLAQTHADVLRGLDSCVQKADLGPEKGVFFRLQVGPLGSAAVATRFCNGLKARDLDCFAVPTAKDGSCLAIHEPAPSEATRAEIVPSEIPASAAPAVPEWLPAPEPSLARRSTPATRPSPPQAGSATVVAATMNPIGTPSEPGKETTVEFDFDSPPKAGHELTPVFSYGAKIESDFEFEKNFDLDYGNDDDRTVATPAISLSLSFEPNPYVRAFAQINLERKFLLDGPDNESGNPIELNIKQAYLTFPRIAEGLALQLGRQRFKDDREWLYDEKLDAARLFYRIDHVGIELSASRKGLVDRDLLNKGRTRMVNNYFLVGRYAWNKDLETTAYVLFREDISRSSRDLVFLGLRSMGEITRDLEYWADLAHVRGAHRSDDVRGFGIDLGATYVFDEPLEPSLTFSVAFGTGDSDSDDGVDRRFRQTGLEDNTAKFNGLTRFKYYGEVLDPELSNMAILTAGIGIRPTKRSSVDLVYHHYQQHRAANRIRGDALGMNPDGVERELGQAVDLVVGYREFKQIDVEFVFGAFLPGDAFSDDADNAYFTGLEFSYTY